MPTRQEGGFNEFTIHLVKLNIKIRNIYWTNQKLCKLPIFHYVFNLLKSFCQIGFDKDKDILARFYPSFYLNVVDI